MSLSIQRRAALWGDRVAVVDHAADEVLSYAALAARIDRTAGRLAALGVGPGDAVSLVTRNRPASLVLPFAARRLGATYAPLSHRLPPSAVAAPHDAVSPAVVVHESAQRDLVRGLDPDETVSLAEFRDVEPAEYRAATPAECRTTDGEVDGFADEAADAPLLAFAARGPEDVIADGADDRDDTDDADSDADAPAVVEYPASTVEWNCVTAAAAWGLGRADCAPVLLPLSHPTGLLCPALPLLYVGGTVVLHRAFDPEDVLAVVVEDSDAPPRPPTLAVGRTPELRELSRAPGFDRVAGSSLSWVACADRPPEAVHAAFAEAGVPVPRVFGTVATGPHNLLVPPERAPWAHPDSVGRPFPDCEARVADDAGEPVEPGVVGRLAVRGRVVPGDGGDGSSSDGDESDSCGWVSTGVRARRAADGDFHVVEGRESENDSDGTEMPSSES